MKNPGLRLSGNWQIPKVLLCKELSIFIPKDYRYQVHQVLFFYFMLISDSFLHAQPKTASSSHTLQKNRFGCNSDLFF